MRYALGARPAGIIPIHRVHRYLMSDKIGAYRAWCILQNEWWARLIYRDTDGWGEKWYNRIGFLAIQRRRIIIGADTSRPERIAFLSPPY